MPMQLSVRSNVKEFERALIGIQKKQIPFATAGAVTDTAFAVRQRIVKRTWPRAITQRNKRFAGAAFRVEKARKTRLRARVFDRLQSEALTRQALGQTRRARRSGHLAIPTTLVKRLASGKIRRRDRPGTLRSSGRSFKLGKGSARHLLVERQGRKRYPLRVLYSLKDSARVPKSFRFYEDAADTAARSFPNFMKRRLAHALRTAR